MERTHPSSSSLSLSSSHASASGRASPDASDLAHASPEKVARIVAACQSEDLTALVDLATSPGGLLQDDLRRTAWPILLGCKGDHDASHPPWSDLPAHRDEEQVAKDVDRAFVYYPKNLSSEKLKLKQRELSDIITEVLRRHPQLCYFQGYHDIVQVLLLVLGYDHTVAAVTRLSILRIRDFMLPTLTAAISHLKLLPAILYRADRQLCDHIQSTLSLPFFALSPTLTLYAHDVQGYRDIARLFDFLLAREPVTSVYLFAAVMLARKEELLDVPLDEREMILFKLQKLPVPFDPDQYISDTMALYNKFPPSSLPFGVWRNVSRYSVLKTYQEPEAIIKQDLSFGEDMFVKHAAEIRRAEALQKLASEVKRKAWMYRRPIGAASVAVLAGLIAWWLGKNQHTTLFPSGPWSVLLYKLLPSW